MYLVTQYLVGNCDASKRYRSTTLNDGIPICIYILAREIEYTFMHISHVLVIHASRKKKRKKTVYIRLSADNDNEAQPFFLI